MNKQTILFLAANPVGTDRLALDREARDIQVELERSGFRDRFELVTRWAVEPLDLIRELRKRKPTVVHFSGHGASGASGTADVAQHGLYFQGPNGSAQLVSAEALAQVFGAVGSSVKLVTLSACHSEPQANALAAHVDCVVGMRTSIRDEAARIFAIGFYGALGDAESVAAAYHHGCAAIGLEGLLDGDKPRLTVRDGIDARLVVLADLASSDTEVRPRGSVSLPTPAYANAEVEALSKQLERARQRQQNLRDAGLATDEVDREILELRKKLRDGGQLRAGDSLGDGRYLLVKPVGRGGFATVWEAWERAVERRVAIKVLHHHLADDPQRKERFFRGARVMINLKHPAVVRVLDPRGEDESFCYFVMELVHDGNLREAVLSQRVKRDRVLPLILQVGEALAEAHRKQLIHRDIKPANILLDEHGNAKLTDFDLVGAHDTTGGTRTGALGTVVYAAPECLDKPQDATARADVFGLGMTAIFGLVGRELSLSTFRSPESTIAGLDCSAQVKAVLQRAVAWEPQQRYADADEMVAVLEKAQMDNPELEESAWLDEFEESAWLEEFKEGLATQPRKQRLVPSTRYLRSASMAAKEDAMRVHEGVHFGQLAAMSTAEDVQELEARPGWVIVSGRDHYGEWAEFIVKDVRHRMRWVPPGRFLMGTPLSKLGRWKAEGPQHEVTLTRGYWLGETPVTQALWVAVAGENPSGFCGERPQDLARPVEQVSWEDCQRFLDVLNDQVAGLAARLPTEAEWEWACRAGTTTATWVGELSGEGRAPELDTIAWYEGNSNGETHPVGRKTANPYGLHDMLGNVSEWCADGKREYTVAPVTDPLGDLQGPLRVYRGGSWRTVARLVHAASRFARPRVARADYLGFRLALAGDQAALR